MCQDAGQRCREAEAIGQHVLGAGLAEFGAEELLAVEDLADDALGIGRIEVALFPCRSGGKPAAFGDVLLHLGEIGRVVFLHHAVAIGAAEVEDVVRVLFEQVEIKQHRVLDVLADGGGVLPAPLGIEVSVADDIQGRLLGEIRLGSLGPRAGQRDHKGQAEDASHMPNRLAHGAGKRHVPWDILVQSSPNRSRTKCRTEYAIGWPRAACWRSPPLPYRGLARTRRWRSPSRRITSWRRGGRRPRSGRSSSIRRGRRIGWTRATASGTASRIRAGASSTWWTRRRRPGPWYSIRPNWRHRWPRGPGFPTTRSLCRARRSAS